MKKAIKQNDEDTEEFDEEFKKRYELEMKGLNLIHKLFDEDELDYGITDEGTSGYELIHLKHGSADLYCEPRHKILTKRLCGDIKKMNTYEFNIVELDSLDIFNPNECSPWMAKTKIKKHENNEQFFEDFNKLTPMHNELVDANLKIKDIRNRIHDAEKKIEMELSSPYLVEPLRFTDPQSDIFKLCKNEIELKDEIVMMFIHMRELIVPVYDYIYNSIVNNAHNDVHPSEKAISVYSNVVHTYMLLIDTAFIISLIDDFYIFDYKRFESEYPREIKPHMIREYDGVKHERNKFKMIAAYHTNPIDHETIHE